VNVARWEVLIYKLNYVIHLNSRIDRGDTQRCYSFSGAVFKDRRRRSKRKKVKVRQRVDKRMWRRQYK
jgi:hypothetical protein